MGLLDEDLTQQVIAEVIGSLKAGKAAGPDSLPILNSRTHSSSLVLVVGLGESNPNMYSRVGGNWSNRKA